MPSIVEFVLLYLILYKYTTLFVVVFLAGVIVPIPIAMILVAVGALASQQYFSLYGSLATAVLANSMGDMCAYFFFLKFSRDILHEKYTQKYSFFTKLEYYFKKYTYVSIFISRIIGVFGTPVNFLSGYMKVKPSEFVLFDLLGNFVFVLIFLSLGYLFGDGWVNISGFVDTVMGSLTTIILLVTIGILWSKKRAS
jgi:membrane-associated protein